MPFLTKIKSNENSFFCNVKKWFSLVFIVYLWTHDNIHLRIFIRIKKIIFIRECLLYVCNVLLKMWGLSIYVFENMSGEQRLTIHVKSNHNNRLFCGASTHQWITFPSGPVFHCEADLPNKWQNPVRRICLSDTVPVQSPRKLGACGHEMEYSWRDSCHRFSEWILEYVHAKYVHLFLFTPMRYNKYFIRKWQLQVRFKLKVEKTWDDTNRNTQQRPPNADCTSGILCCKCVETAGESIVLLCRR